VLLKGVGVTIFWGLPVFVAENVLLEDGILAVESGLVIGTQSSTLLATESGEVFTQASALIAEAGALVAPQSGSISIESSPGVLAWL